MAKASGTLSNDIISEEAALFFIMTIVVEVQDDKIGHI